jgi:16S rRNA processing protein RimM
MPLVRLGKIVACHGVRGFLRVTSADPALIDHIMHASVLYLESPGREPESRTVESVRPQRKGLLLKLAGVDTREDAEGIVGGLVSTPEETLPPLKDHEFYYSEIRGFRVSTTNGRDLGSITETFHNGSTDVWIVQDGRREYLIPVIADVVRDIDRSRRAVTIEPLDGLLDP